MAAALPVAVLVRFVPFSFGSGSLAQESPPTCAYTSCFTQKRHFRCLIQAGEKSPRQRALMGDLNGPSDSGVSNLRHVGFDFLY